MSISADDRLRAATAALSDHEHLERVWTTLTAALVDAQHDIQQLARDLDKEQQDVAAIQANLFDVVLDALGLARHDLSQEQREVAQAQVRLREAVGARDELRNQLAAIDTRLAQSSRARLASEVQAARAAKEAELFASAAPEATELSDLTIRLTSIEIELVPLEDAVAAGEAAIAALSHLLTTLDRIRAELSAASRERAATTRTLAGDAQARLLVFHRTLADLPAPDDRTPPYDATVQPGDRVPFADSWLKQLLAGGDPAARLAAARAAIFDRLEHVRALLGPVRARHEQISRTRQTLIDERERLLAGG